MKIPLHKPLWGRLAEQAVVRAMRTGAGTADGPESSLLRTALRNVTRASYAIPVTSCTHAMEAAVASLGAHAGDEVIVPSFTLASTATAVMIRGATPVFADIDPVNFSLDPSSVERMITKKTVGIMTVHYAGFAGRSFDVLRSLAKKHKLWLIEDAAHCIGAEYKGKALGTYGDVGALSFHGTKNVAAGEGGAILTDSPRLSEKMEIFRSIGTDRMAFLEGKVSAYRWVGEGSSFMLSDLLAALITVQLNQIERINRDRRHIAETYSQAFLQFQGKVLVPTIPKGMTTSNWHIYALKFETKKQRDIFLGNMHAKDIGAASHYMPLHVSPMGKKLHGGKQPLPVTEHVADTIVRMPIYAGMTEKELNYIVTIAQKALKAKYRYKAMNHGQKKKALSSRILFNTPHPFH